MVILLQKKTRGEKVMEDKTILRLQGLSKSSEIKQWWITFRLKLKRVKFSDCSVLTEQAKALL